MKKFIVVIFVVFLAGCSSFYFGYSKEEWVLLSETERAAAKEAYRHVIAQKDKVVQGNPRDDAANAFVERAVGKTGD